jgi:hypothetical protein
MTLQQLCDSVNPLPQLERILRRQIRRAVDIWRLWDD